jgi:hypothetical protein
VARVPRIVGSYTATLTWRGIRPGTEQARAVASTVRELAEAPELPLPDDVEAPLPPRESDLVERNEGRRLMTAFVRRVRGHRLWVWYLPRAEQVALVLVTSLPPA